MNGANLKENKGGTPMNINRFTQKSVESINNSQKIAMDHGNQAIEQLHILYSLLDIEDSLIEKLLERWKFR